jgi:hypothetical protein
MLNTHRHWAIALGIAACLVIAFGGTVLAGTTGAIRGRVYDSASLFPIQDVKVSAVAPSQSATTTTDVQGNYTFLSLGPDTYTVTAEKSGYDMSTKRGITVFADHVQDLPIALVKSITTIGRVSVTATTELVKPGTTSNVYSVNAAAQSAAAALAGSGNLNTAYSAMASVPGVNVPQGQQGWYQPVYIRGGDLDQVGWEFDGIPVNRAYDNAPQTFVSSLGQQELQVYTGGVLPTSDSSGISGYVNQVVKRGTTPGFYSFSYGIGTPTYYNKVSAEAGGATSDQNFSWYVGTLAANTSFRYINNSNGAGLESGFFYPLNTKVFAAPNDSFTPGMTYGIQQTQDRETIVNLHLGVPHHNGTSKDDIQALYLSSFILMPYYSSVNDLGGPANVYPVTTENAPIGVLSFSDGWVYNGTQFAPPNSAQVVPYLYPSTPHYWGQALPLDIRDTNSNEVQIGKLQYQRNFSSTSYLRIFGYGMYSTWFIHGVIGGGALGFCCYGGEIGDYELPVHTYGGVADYSNQLSDKHLLTAGLFYNAVNIQRYTTTHGFPGNNGDFALPSTQPQSLFASGYSMMNNVGPGGLCYGPGGVSGGPVTCFGSPEISSFSIPSCSGVPCQGTIFNLMRGTVPFPAASGTQWLVTENGYSYNFNKVHPIFSAFSVNDDWHPDDKLTVNVGLRVENYAVGINDSTSIGYNSRQFWFNNYNNEYCFAPGYFQPLYKGPTGTCAASFPLTSNTNFVNTNPSSFSHTVWQPRLGTTYTLDPNDVLRFSAGLYARPASTRDASWNTGQQNLASFLGQNFALYGQNTPNHDLLPDQSTNFDLSWEHHFQGTQMSMKITPYWRSTENQVQQTIVNALSELFADFNTGHLVSTGVEFALNGGSFAHNGLAFQFAYTYNSSHISYHDFPNTSRNVIDNMNSYIQLYNSFTAACAGATPTTSNTAMCGPFGSLNVGTAATNPWFVAPAQPLLNRTGTYAPYDLVPVPYAAANGYEVPDVATLVLNYKYNKWNVTPTFAYSAGTVYGSPLSWEAVGATSTPGSAAFAVSPNCTSSATVASASCGVPLMVPDPYTGHFDSFGEFLEPSRLTLNMAIGYDFTSQVSGVVTLSNIVDQCYQRHYPWDAPHTCIYSNLPSFFLQPIGSRFYNDLGLAKSPLTAPQLRYPYAMWLNNNNTGFVGVSMPFQASFEINWKT